MFPRYIIDKCKISLMSFLLLLFASHSFFKRDCLLLRILSTIFEAMKHQRCCSCCPRLYLQVPPISDQPRWKCSDTMLSLLTAVCSHCERPLIPEKDTLQTNLKVCGLLDLGWQWREDQPCKELQVLCHAWSVGLCMGKEKEEGIPGGGDVHPGPTWEL